MNEAKLIDGATRVEQAVRDLGAAHADMSAELRAASKAAYARAGTYGQEDVRIAAGADRLDEEIIGVMVHAGLGELLERARTTLRTPVSDFVARWQKRIDGDQFTTKRPQT
jgi:hypothetical protein